MRTIWFVAATIALVASGGFAFAEDAVDPTAIKSEDGKYLDKDGNATFKVAPDGTIDWYTDSGYRRYHSECHVCHGPDAEGSTFAPPLKNSIKTMSYGEFLEVVASGRKNVSTSQENVESRSRRVRSTPMNGHRQTGPTGPFRAKERTRSGGRGWRRGRAITSAAVTI